MTKPVLLINMKASLNRTKKGKKFTLHCSVVDPVHSRYRFHLSDDTTLDPVFVDPVLRDIFIKYDIRNQDLWIQSDNAPTKYRNKNAFFFAKSLLRNSI